MSKFDVLADVERNDVILEPFPHVIIKNCLPLEEYNELAANYPREEWFDRGAIGSENARLNCSFYDVLDKYRDDLSPAWVHFLEQQSSNDFYRKLVDLFEPQVKTTFPKIEKIIGKDVRDFSVTLREPGGAFNNEYDVFVDHNIGINTPSSKRSSVRGPHIDGLQKMFGGLMYFRSEDDNTKGGNLELYGWKNQREFQRYTEVLLGDVELFSEVEYEANTLVMWLNSPDAVHGVSARSHSKVNRRLVYFSGRVNPNKFRKGLFPDYWPKKDHLCVRVSRRIQKFQQKVFGSTH